MTPSGHLCPSSSPPFPFPLEQYALWCGDTLSANSCRELIDFSSKATPFLLGFQEGKSIPCPRAYRIQPGRDYSGSSPLEPVNSE